MPQRDLESWMWERANDLLDQVDTLQRHFFQPGGRRLRPTWQPPVDVFETVDALLIIVAIPGVDPSTVEVLLNQGRLVVRGIRSLGNSLPEACQQAVVHRLELPHGLFERSLELTEYEVEAVEKRFVNGCLILSLKKAI